MVGDQSLFSAPRLADWASLRPGQRVTLRAQSPLYKGEYSCAVVAISRMDLRVTMPMENGKLVLIPVGTRVWVDVPTGSGTRTVDAVVVDRKGGSERSLLLQPWREAAPAADSEPPLCPTVAVTSGKGGVGKSFMAVNLGVALADLGLKVAIVDADLGTANVDVLLNLTPRYTLLDVAARNMSIFDVLVEGPGGLVILPGGSGFQQLTSMSDAEFEHMHRQMKRLQRHVDVLLIDTGSGVSHGVTRFVLAADAAVLVTTPEPHAIVDAYALVKVLAAYNPALRLRLVINKVRDRTEADAIAANILFAGERFLQAKLDYLGYVVQDEAVELAVRQQRLLADVRTGSAAAQNLRDIAGKLASALDVWGRPAAGTPDDAAAATPRPPTFLQRVRALFSR